MITDFLDWLSAPYLWVLSRGTLYVMTGAFVSILSGSGLLWLDVLTVVACLTADCINNVIDPE